MCQSTETQYRQNTHSREAQPAGKSLKHISDLFDETAGSRHGILTRVPKDQRTGRIEKSDEPVRVYLRTADLSIGDYGNPFAMTADELNILRESDDAVYFDYYDFEKMLDDGWVVD